MATLSRKYVFIGYNNCSYHKQQVLINNTVYNNIFHTALFINKFLNFRTSAVRMLRGLNMIKSNKKKKNMNEHFTICQKPH